MARFIIFFQIGKWISKYEQVRRAAHDEHIHFISMIIYLITFVLFGYMLNGVNACSFVLPLCAIVVLYNFSIKYEKQLSYNGIFPYLGRKSLDIYLIHFLFVSEYVDEKIIMFGDVFYLQIIILIIIAMGVIIISLAVSYILSSSKISSFIMFGRGEILESVIRYVRGL